MISKMTQQIASTAATDQMDNKSLHELFLEHLSTEHNLTEQQIARYQKQRQSEPNFPLGILECRDLGSFEAIVKHMHEKGKRLGEIAKLTNRDARTIWNAYDSAQRKHKERIITAERPEIPIRIIQDRKYSVLESVVNYLHKELSMTYPQIARALKRDSRTIHTVKKRIEAKNAKV